MFCHLGQDFSSKIQLDILPHLDIPRGVYSVNVEYTTICPDQLNEQIHNYVSYTSDHRNLKLIVGRDVYSLNISVHADSSQSYFYASYASRLDNLIILNLVCKLLKS